MIFIKANKLLSIYLSVYVFMYFSQFWDGLTGQLKCLYAEGKSGVTALCFVANR